MPVTRKPKTVDEFIQAGTVAPSVAQPKTVVNEGDAVQPVKLRLPQDLLNQIDESVAKRKPTPSRHQWILEAIYEKLKDDNGDATRDT